MVLEENKLILGIFVYYLLIVIINLVKVLTKGTKENCKFIIVHLLFLLFNKLNSEFCLKISFEEKIVLETTITNPILAANVFKGFVFQDFPSEGNAFSYSILYNKSLPPQH